MLAVGIGTESNQTTNMATPDRVLRRVATAITTNDTAAILQPLQKLQLHYYLDPSKYYSVCVGGICGPTLGFPNCRISFGIEHASY